MHTNFADGKTLLTEVKYLYVSATGESYLVQFYGLQFEGLREATRGG
jgi:hypothetical protein